MTWVIEVRLLLTLHVTETGSPSGPRPLVPECHTLTKIANSEHEL